MQSAFLRHINHNIENKEQMLDFVGQYQFMLDAVNKVTCIYRLAKMFTSPQVRCDARWKAELASDEGFNRLLRSLSSDLLNVWLEIHQQAPSSATPRALASSPSRRPSLSLQRTPSAGARTPSPDTGEAAAAAALHHHHHSNGHHHHNGHHGHHHGHHTPQKGGGGTDYARCLSNLIWALVKLELVDKADSVAADLIIDITPLVLHFIPRYNSQGIANIIWSYAKLPAPPVPAVLKLLQHMTYMLGEPSEARSFDAQALSNSIWAAAHMSSKGVVAMEGGTSSELAKFLVAVANNATYQLRALEHDRPRYQAYHYLKVTETKFACQALVNIAWSFATLLSGCARQNASILALFSAIRTEAVFRLTTLRAIMESGDLTVARSSGSFNEQALSNLVFAYEKVELLDGELLGAVFAVAHLRLQGLQAGILLKPQEVCTLLRAARLEVAHPWPFVLSLQRLLTASSQVSAHWTELERAEVMAALHTAITHQHLLQQRAQVAAAAAAEDAKQREQLQLQMHLQEEQQRRQQQQHHRRRHQELAAAAAQQQQQQQHALQSLQSLQSLSSGGFPVSPGGGGGGYGQGSPTSASPHHHHQQQQQQQLHHLVNPNPYINPSPLTQQHPSPRYAGSPVAAPSPSHHTHHAHHTHSQQHSLLHSGGGSTLHSGSSNGPRMMLPPRPPTGRKSLSLASPPVRVTTTNSLHTAPASAAHSLHTAPADYATWGPLSPGGGGAPMLGGSMAQQLLLQSGGSGSLDSDPSQDYLASTVLAPRPRLLDATSSYTYDW